MEKPDSEGYVNVVWPSKNVPHGGIFHTRTVESSMDRQQFLKLLLEESKLETKLRQRSAAGGVDSKSRGADPTVCASEPPRARARPRTSRRRSLSAIRCSGDLHVDSYRPLKRGQDRERLKDELAASMAGGEEAPQRAAPPLRRAAAKPAPALPTAKETWNDLVTQIRERAEWLAEMEWLGHAEPHRHIVQEQIAERMRALDALGVDSVCSTARSSRGSTCGRRSSAASATKRAPVVAQPTGRGRTNIDPG